MKNTIGSNQYVKTIKYRKVIIVLAIIIALIGTYQGLNNHKSKTAPESVVTVKDDITPEQREMLKKQAYLAERKVIATNKKNKLQAEIETIETELESIRAEKLSFK